MQKNLVISLLTVMALLLMVAACSNGGATTAQETTKTVLTTAGATVTPSTTVPVTTVAPVTTTAPKTTAATSAVVTTPATSSTTRPPAASSVPTTSAAAPTTSLDLAAMLGKAGKVVSMSYDMVTTAGTTNTTAKVYMKGTKMRMDISQSGIDMRMYIDTAAKTVYIYTVSTNTLMKSTWSDSNESAAQKAGDILGYQPVVVGTATIDGHLCTIIQYTYLDGTNQINAKTWIWNDYGLPIRMEITDKTGTTVIEYKNISFSDISDSTLNPPAGASTFAIPTLPTGIPTGLIPTGLIPTYPGT